MSDLRQSSEVVGIVLSDVHFSARPPIARAAEPDWFEAMARPWREVAALRRVHNCHILVAGDLWHHWNQPPEVINFVIRLFSELEMKPFTIPGQHDLPSHRYDLVHKSAYRTLGEASVITDLKGYDFHVINNMLIGSFPWGHDIKPPDAFVPKELVRLALVHSYIWMRGKSYPGAKEEQKVGGYRDQLQGYHAAAFGDNHLGFYSGLGAAREEAHATDYPEIINCGAFIRRNTDEREYRPQVGLVYANGIIEPHYLDTSADVFTAEALEVGAAGDYDMKKFLEELAGLEVQDLAYEDAVRQWMAQNTISPRAEALIMEVLKL